MTSNDLKRLITGPTLFRLDAILSPKLIPIVYALGLAALLIWAITHFFSSFGAGFGHGLWGLLEIAVYGLLMFIALRIGCEALIVYFRDRSPDSPAVRSTASLLDEVRDAIRDLSEHDETDRDDYSEVGEYETYPPRPARTPPAGSASPVTPPPAAREPAAPQPAAAPVPPESETVVPPGETAPPSGPHPEPGDPSPELERRPATTPGETHGSVDRNDGAPRT